MVKYIRWLSKVNSAHGIFKLSLDGPIFKYEINSESESIIPASELVAFLWFSPLTKEFREAAIKIRRQSDWKVWAHTGVSGATDWWIKFIKNEIVKSTDIIWHESADGKANQNLSCSIKDIYDLLWDFKGKGIYSSSFYILTSSDFTYTDITEKIMTRLETFKNGAHKSFEGFGSKDVDHDDDIAEFSVFKPVDADDGDKIGEFSIKSVEK
jgi:hypothetical protein